MSFALAAGIKQTVLNIYRVLSNIAVGVKDYQSQADTEKRLHAAERCRHEILTYLYAGDAVGGALACQALLALLEELETEASKIEPFNREAVTEACLHSAATATAVQTTSESNDRGRVILPDAKPLIEFLSPSESRNTSRRPELC